MQLTTGASVGDVPEPSSDVVAPVVVVGATTVARRKEMSTFPELAISMHRREIETDLWRSSASSYMWSV